MELKHLEQILSLLKQNDVNEFELEQEGTHLKLSRGARQIITVQQAAGQAAVAVEPAITAISQTHATAVAAAPAAETKAAPAISDKLVKVESPLVGTFYRKPSPDAQAFVSEGQQVKKGDTLCIVEAMKLMNEIESPCNGKIEKVLISDGHVVEYGEVLFLINPA